MLDLNYSKKQLSPIIEKYKINPETNIVFQAILTLFPGQTNYQIWAIKAVFDNVVKLDVIENIKIWAENNQTEIQNLSKGNIVGYKSADEFKLLHQEIVGLNNIRIVKREIEKFNTDQRKEFMEAAFKGIDTPLKAATSSAFNKWITLFKNFASLNQKTQKKLIVSVSAFRGNVPEMVRVIEGAFSTRYEWNKEDLLGFMARNCPDCSVVFDNDHIVIARIGSYNSSEKLCGNGRTTWCLTNRKGYWDQYVGNYKDRLQFFLWDFSKREDDELAHVGFTVSAKDGIVEAQSTQNSCLRGSGINYHGRQYNINNVFEDNNIPTDIWVKLGELKFYTWTVDSFLEYAAAHDLQVMYSENNRVIVKPRKNDELAPIVLHTLIRCDRTIDNKNDCYVVLDFNEKKDAASSIIAFYYQKDRYELDKLSASSNAIGERVDAGKFFERTGIRESYYVNTTDVDPRILLHKYIDENNEKDALEIIRKGGETFDVNYIFNLTAPIYTAIDNRMMNVFGAIYTHKGFKNDLNNSRGECILAHLMYEFIYCEETLNNAKASKNNASIEQLTKEMNAIKTMINIVLDDESTDFNYLNFNGDTCINIAAESKGLLWVVERLLSKPGIKLNCYNDYNYSAIGNAIRNNNLDAVAMIGNRPDVLIREEDIELAKRMGINLKKYIPSYTVTPSDEALKVEGSNAEIDTYRALFNAVFGTVKTK